MKLKFNKENKLEFDLQDFFDTLPDETKLELVESLACQEAVIKHVTDQLLDGWTENMWHGGRSCSIDVVPFNALDKGVREIAKRSGDVAKEEIDRLERELARQKEENKVIDDKYWTLYHKVNKGAWWRTD